MHRKASSTTIPSQAFTVFKKYSIQFLFTGFARLFWVITFFAVFVPFVPLMPSSDLDSSWKFGMNQAIAQRLHIGSDIIYTFGPYASIYTMVYHPATDHLMMWGSILIGIGYVMIVIILSMPNHSSWVLIFSLILPMLILYDDFFHARDAILFSYPMVLTLVIYRMSIPIAGYGKIESSTPVWIVMLIAFFSLGMLPLIKGTMSILVVSLCLMCSLALWNSGKKSMAIMVTVLPVISIFVFWLLAGQSLGALPSYFVNLNEIVWGYTDAMSLERYPGDIWYFGLGHFFIFTSVFVERPFSMRSHAFLTSILGIFMFLSYKAGFVRHDMHAMIAAQTLVLIGLSLPLVLKNKTTLPVFLLTLLIWFSMSLNYSAFNYQELYPSLLTVYTSAWDGAFSRLIHSEVLAQNFNSSLLSLRRELHIPHLSGTTDIYSYDQSYLLASDNNWSPRPVFQSFAAYNPTLLQLNEKHLRGVNAADHLLFRVETINGRLPALEDGMSWPTIMTYYCVGGYIGPYIHFEKRPYELPNSLPPVQYKTIYSTTQQLGGSVVIPEIKSPLFAEISLTPNTFGKFLSTAYKLPYIHMTLTLTNGNKKHYRVIPTMMVTPFIVSPLIETTDDFYNLTTSSDYDKLSFVRSFEIYSVMPDGGPVPKWAGMLWNDSYKINLSTISQDPKQNSCGPEKYSIPPTSSR